MYFVQCWVQERHVDSERDDKGTAGWKCSMAGIATKPVAKQEVFDLFVTPYSVGDLLREF